MSDLKPHSWAQSGSPTSTILNRIREHNIEFGGSPARVAHTYDVPLYEIPAGHVVVPRELLESHIQQLDDWNSAMEKIIGKPIDYRWESLEQLRALLQP